MMDKMLPSSEIVVAFFRWQSIGQEMARLDRRGELCQGHKILRIYARARNKLVRLARDQPDDMPYLAEQEMIERTQDEREKSV